LPARSAHILRELQSVGEQGSSWAFEMRDFLLELYEAGEQGKGVVEDFELRKRR
jgi:hypothetical protein